MSRYRCALAVNAFVFGCLTFISAGLFADAGMPFSAATSAFVSLICLATCGVIWAESL